MKKLLLILLFTFTIIISGCDEMDPEVIYDVLDECEDITECMPENLDDFTTPLAEDYFTQFLLDEMDSSISSIDHCEKYYNDEIDLCASTRDTNLGLNMSLTLHSFDAYDIEDQIYKIGVVYQDDEIDEFLEYHFIQFYVNSDKGIQFEFHYSENQYDVEDYELFAIEYANDVMTDVSSGALCTYYFSDEYISNCETETNAIRESFVSMEFVEMTYNTEGFYTLIFTYNNGEIDENITSHWNFAVNQESQLKIMYYGVPSNE